MRVVGNSVCFKEMRLEFRITFLLQKRDNFQKRVETYGPPYFATQVSVSPLQVQNPSLVTLWLNSSYRPSPNGSTFCERRSVGLTGDFRMRRDDLRPRSGKLRCIRAVNEMTND